MKKIILIFFASALFNFVSYAQERMPKVDARQKTQNTRIHQGKNNDEITRREASLLRKEQKHIRRSERRAKSDGDVTTMERRRLDRKQDRASRHIHRAKNNEVTSN
jgi:hypothetical protein